VRRLEEDDLGSQGALVQPAAGGGHPKQSAAARSCTSW
jgi:hypothetical protein